MTKELFIKYATSLYTANEDARSSCVAYAEQRYLIYGKEAHRSKESFIVSSYYQCGELSIKFVDDILNGEYQLLSYLVSAQICIQTFYNDKNEQNQRFKDFSEDVSKLLSDYDLNIGSNSLYYLLRLSQPAGL
jgi:beta-lactamase class D